MTPTFTDDHLLLTIVGNAIWCSQARQNPNWVTQLGGVKVHSHDEGTIIDFSFIDLNMEFV